MFKFHYVVIFLTSLVCNMVYGQAGIEINPGLGLPDTEIRPPINLEPLPYRFGNLAYRDGCSSAFPFSNRLDFILYEKATGRRVNLEEGNPFSEIKIFDVSRTDFLLDREPKLLSRHRQAWVQNMVIGSRRSDSVHTNLLAYNLDGDLVATAKIQSPPPPTIRRGVELIAGDTFFRRSFQGMDYWYLPVSITNLDSPVFEPSTSGSGEFWRNPGQVMLTDPGDFSRDPRNDSPPGLNISTEAVIAFLANPLDEQEMEDQFVTVTFAETNPYEVCLDIEAGIEAIDGHSHSVRVAFPGVRISGSVGTTVVGDPGSCRAGSVGTPCTGPPPEGMCSNRGAEFAVPGEMQCRRGRLVCDTSDSAGVAFCSSETAANGPDCGLEVGARCSSTAQCIPGSACNIQSGRCEPPSSSDPTACRLSPGTCWIPPDLTSNDPALCRDSGAAPMIPDEYRGCLSSEGELDCTIDDSATCPGFSYPGKTECFATSRFCRATPKGLEECRCMGSATTTREIAACSCLAAATTPGEVRACRCKESATTAKEVEACECLEAATTPDAERACSCITSTSTPETLARCRMEALR